jgi:2-methylisocitrate lyase-like PEP mutase family enzyme
MRSDVTELRERFRGLHRDGVFVMPNAWDVGSARILEVLGASAIATTSSGHAATLGRQDFGVRRDEMLAHAEAISAAVDVPVNVDSARCFGDDPAAVADTVRFIGATGAAGCSIEDYDPKLDRIDPIEVAVERVAAAADEAQRAGLVLTGRAEAHLYPDADLHDTIARLQAYQAAGADVVYAPGLTAPADIARVVAEVDAPVNVLALQETPPVAELATLGVRRVSTGGSLAFRAYAALVDAAREVLGAGTSTYRSHRLPPDIVEQAFATE